MKWPIFQFSNFLKPEPYLNTIQDPQVVSEQYRYWRIRICLSLFLGYAAYYFTRKNFSIVMPMVGQDLGFDKAQLGMILSFFAISYGINKFIAGIISDRSNPRYLMAFGLIATGILNILFGMSSSFYTLCFFWVVNGFFQACGWPACCKSLTYWFKQSKRGFWYSVCSTSQNVGGAIISLFAPFVAVEYGWRFAMFVPALISIVMGFILINRLRDVPQSLGLPPVDISLQSISPDNTQTFFSVKEILFKQVLNNKYVWIFSLSYFFIYIVRTAIHDWSAFYLMEERDFEDIISASQGIFWFEIGGLIGMLVAGWGSDYLFRGNRIPTMIISAGGLIFSVMALWCSSLQWPILDLFYLGAIGFFVFGPQMIIGLAAAECVDKRAAAAANGFAGLFGYIGAAAAGWPIGKIIELWHWDGYYSCIIFSSAIILVILLPLWSLSHTKKVVENASSKVLAT